jgi:class 3 adenylate cyclase
VSNKLGAIHFNHTINIQTGDELQRLADRINEMSKDLAASQEKSERINRLRGFLAPQVAELVESSGAKELLAGQQREVVVLFTDLRGFSSFSGKAEPAEIITVLSEYYQALGEAINTFGATLSGDFTYAGNSGFGVFWADLVFRTRHLGSRPHHFELHSDISHWCEIHQCVQTELVNLSTQQIIKPGLCDF